MTRTRAVTSGRRAARSRAKGPGEGAFSIAVTARMTGLSIDALRVWERRYGFPSPRRTSSGTRAYSRADVDRLVLVARALKAGYRAGEVVGQSAAALEGLVAESRVESKAPAASSLASILEPLARDQVSRVQSALRHQATALGARRFLVEIAGPLCERVGELWAAGELDVRHEHLFTEQLRTQLRSMVTAFDGEPSGETVLLATLPGEHHVLGLEMAMLYLAVAGTKPRVLGADTPPSELVAAAKAMRAAAVGLSVSLAADPRAVEAHVAWLLGALPPKTRLWVGGKAARRITLSSRRLGLVVDWDDVDREVAKIGKAT